MTEYRLRVVGDVWGPRTRSRAPSIAERGERQRQDVYLCGHCGMILERGTTPPPFRTCYNCGTLNCSDADGAALQEYPDYAAALQVSSREERNTETRER